MLGIDYSGQKFSLSSDPKNAVAVFSPAVLFMDGREMRLDLVWTDGYTIVSQKNDFHVTDVFKDNGDGLFSVRRSIKNVGNVTHEIKSIFEAKILFSAEKFLIPCVSYNKNIRGSNGAPAGFEYMGENWVFAYDRSGIPSCTLSENRAVAFALFASDRDADSLRSSCSFLAEAGETVHRLIHPVTEAPYTYSGKTRLTERYDEFITLAPGATFDCEMFMYACRPRRQNYAFAQLADRILEEKKDQFSMVLPPEKVWQLGIEFAKALLYDYKGYRLTITHFAPRLYRVQHDVGMTTPKMAEMMKDPYYTELGRFDERFEIGWADQGLLNARMMAVHAHKTQDSELFDTAVGIFDAWTEKQGENGLLYTQFQLYYEDEAYDFALPDVCNLGWAMAEMVRMYRFLQSIGIEKRAYLTFATRLCDFFCTHYSDEYGFGKSWTLDGECVDTTGSIGGFIIPGLLETYKLVKDSRYLDCALKAMDFYYKRDIDNFVCLAGAIDCCCIDKETAYPFVVAANMLYEITGEACHLEREKQASYYFLSWMFF